MLDEPAISVTPTPELSQPPLRGSKAVVEYRDAEGNVLPESLVEELRKQGKVSFETRYETRTRLANGHEVDVVDGHIAHPHANFEAANEAVQA